jgi:hypothetical protein
LLREYSVMTAEVWKILSTLDGGPLNFDAQDFSLLSLYVNPSLVTHTYNSLFVGNLEGYERNETKENLKCDKIKFHMVYILDCKQQLRTNTRRYEILHTLNLGCSFIILREPCNNQRLRCDIAWLHVINYLYHGVPS